MIWKDLWDLTFPSAVELNLLAKRLLTGNFTCSTMIYSALRAEILQICSNHTKYIYLTKLFKIYLHDLFDLKRFDRFLAVGDSWQETSHSAHWYIVPYGQKSHKSVQILQNIFISQNYSRYIYMICLKRFDRFLAVGD